MIVVDASVAAKWFLPEAGSQTALALHDSPEQLFAPDLIRMEVAAAITRRVRAEKEPLLPDEAIERCTEWFRLLDQAVLSLIPERELIDEAVRLAVEVRHPLQDCLYLVAALRFDAPLITADPTFVRRASARHPRVSLLEGCEAVERFQKLVAEHVPPEVDLVEELIRERRAEAEDE